MRKKSTDYDEKHDTLYTAKRKYPIFYYKVFDSVLKSSNIFEPENFIDPTQVKQVPFLSALRETRCIRSRREWHGSRKDDEFLKRHRKST